MRTEDFPAEQDSWLRRGAKLCEMRTSPWLREGKTPLGDPGEGRGTPTSRPTPPSTPRFLVIVDLSLISYAVQTSLVSYKCKYSHATKQYKLKFTIELNLIFITLFVSEMCSQNKPKQKRNSDTENELDF